MAEKCCALKLPNDAMTVCRGFFDWHHIELITVSSTKTVKLIIIMMIIIIIIIIISFI